MSMWRDAANAANAALLIDDSSTNYTQSTDIDPTGEYRIAMQNIELQNQRIVARMEEMAMQNIELQNQRMEARMEEIESRLNKVIVFVLVITVTFLMISYTYVSVTNTIQHDDTRLYESEEQSTRRRLYAVQGEYIDILDNWYDEDGMQWVILRDEFDENIEGWIAWNVKDDIISSSAKRINKQCRNVMGQPICVCQFVWFSEEANLRPSHLCYQLEASKSRNEKARTQQIRNDINAEGQLSTRGLGPQWHWNDLALHFDLLRDDVDIGEYDVNKQLETAHDKDVEVTVVEHDWMTENQNGNDFENIEGDAGPYDFLFLRMMCWMGLFGFCAFSIGIRYRLRKEQDL
eukprot:945256_1